MPNVPDLQPVADDSVKLLAARERAGLRSLAGAVWTSDESTSYQLNAKCQDFLTRYLRRSLITPDDPNMVQVNRELFTLTFTVRLSRPFLLQRSGLIVYRAIRAPLTQNL
jgi:hypothetical protein